MMTSLTHQVQGSYAASKPLSLKKTIASNNTLVAFPVVKKTDIILSNHRSCLRVQVPLSNRKSFKISSFKGNIQNDESEERENGLKSTNNSVKLSYASKDCNETFAVSSKVNNNLAIQQLFRSWLTLLHTHSKSQPPDGTLEAGPDSNEILEADRKIQNNGIWWGILGLDLAIKIPAMIFIPMYLAVNMKYGPGVARNWPRYGYVGHHLLRFTSRLFKGYVHSTFTASSNLAK
ncbi:uncharacterized protein LOC143613270 [Bidens hawaiensis]|uniref:uncharacterized protein LOC143613270 n=1 Tax=Bidens hawaiensis TaxID=980011 RepID=UPI00404A51F9